MSQAIQKMRADTGCSDLNCMGLEFTLDDDVWNDNLLNLITSQMDIVKYKVKPNSSGEGERVGFYNLIPSSHLYCDLSCVEHTSSKDIVFYTKNGYKFEMFMNLDSQIGVYVDVNGEYKKPNIMGRDVFNFVIPVTEPKFHAQYGQIQANGVKNPNHMYWKTGELCEPNKERNGNGRGCAARIIESGWKMDY